MLYTYDIEIFYIGDFDYFGKNFKLEGNYTDCWDFNEFSASMHKKKEKETVLEINVYPFNIHRKSKDLPKRCFHSFLYYVPLYMK